jgi:hypothetical protein
MQRLGRINRIGSDADFINVYNFYPSAQGDAEINIVERAWNKIQAFHELFGEDSKIFSREEELVIHDLIQHDEDEGSQSLKYIGLLKRFREQNPRRYVELEWLMEKVVSARKAATQKTCAQVKNSRGQWYYAYSDHPYGISRQEMIEALECSETETATDMDTPKLDAALAAIVEQYTMDRLNESIHIKTGATSKKLQKAMNILKDYARIEGLAPECLALLQNILFSMRNGNSVLINEIVKARPNTQVPFAEADIQNWMRYVHTDKNTGEKGIVTLALQCTEGGDNG